MKKSVNVKKTLCDECGAETYGAVCLHCGKDWCYECEKKHVVEYTHAVSFAGSGDGHYCKPCDAQLIASGKDELHTAYRAVAALKAELASWHQDFASRQKVAEARLKKLAPR